MMRSETKKILFVDLFQLFGYLSNAVSLVEKYTSHSKSRFHISTTLR